MLGTNWPYQQPPYWYLPMPSIIFENDNSDLQYNNTTEDINNKKTTKEKKNMTQTTKIIIGSVATALVLAGVGYYGYKNGWFKKKN